MASPLEGWLAQIIASAQYNPALATEVAQRRRLVKGHSDTHARGPKNYQTLMAAVTKAGSRLAPVTLRELRDAALARAPQPAAKETPG